MVAGWATVVGTVMMAVGVRVIVGVIVAAGVIVVVPVIVVVGHWIVGVSEPTVMVMPAGMMVGVPGGSAADAAPEQREAERRDRQPRGQGDPRIEALRDDVLRGIE